MRSGRSDTRLGPWLCELVDENAGRILGSIDHSGRVEKCTLSRPRSRKPSRHHRELTVEYSVAGARRRKQVWLKFVTNARSRYEIHTSAWERTRQACNLFPEPYFCGARDGYEVIGMERVEGESLRRLFLGQPFTSRRHDLGAAFAAFGNAMRTFHDAFAPGGHELVADLEHRVGDLVQRSAYLADHERAQALEGLTSAVVRADLRGVALPRVPVHHDCTLRNVVVRRDGSPCLLDLDSMRAARKSRWYDVVVFLINLESQMRYAPIGDAASIAAAWRSFWDGYSGVELPDGLSAEQAEALLFVVKLEYLVGGPWRPVFEVYTGPLAPRYLKPLKQSLLSGEYLVAR